MLDRAVYFPYLAQFIHARVPCLLWEKADIEQAEEWLTDIAQSSDVAIHIYHPYGVIQTLEPAEKRSVNQSLTQAIQLAMDQMYEYSHSVFVFILRDPLDMQGTSSQDLERCIHLAFQRKGSMLIITADQLPQSIQTKGILFNDVPSTIQSSDMKNQLTAGNPSQAFFTQANWTTYNADQVKSNEMSDAYKRRLQNFSNLTNVVQRIDVGDVKKSSSRFDQLHRWLQQKRIHFKARDLQAPHGVLFLGQDADAQRKAAELAAHAWSVPLYRLDMAEIQLSDFEQNCGAFKDLLAWIEEKSPCVFWIDHVEVAFNSDSQERNQTHARFVSEVLIWQQQRKSKTLAILTARDILKIPVELLHKGGFDKIFHLDIWTEQERENVLRFLIGKHHLPFPSASGLKQLVSLVRDLSSEDLKQVFRDLALQSLIQGAPDNPDQLYVQRFSDLQANQQRRRS